MRLLQNLQEERKCTENRVRTCAEPVLRLDNEERKCRVRTCTEPVIRLDTCTEPE